MDDETAVVRLIEQNCSQDAVKCSGGGGESLSGTRDQLFFRVPSLTTREEGICRAEGAEGPQGAYKVIPLPTYLGPIIPSLRRV